jgi:hypothetical protein
MIRQIGSVTVVGEIQRMLYHRRRTILAIGIADAFLDDAAEVYHMRGWYLGGLEIVVGAAGQHHDLYPSSGSLAKRAPKPTQTVWIALHELIVQQEHRSQSLGETETK